MTTVNIPTLLEGYADNFEQYGHRQEVSFIVIGDLKTPHSSVRALIDNIAARGFDAQYYDVEQQERWLERFPDLRRIVPYNTDCRRSIGYLMAVEQGAEVIVLIDDDNFVTDGDYLAGHAIVGKTIEMDAVASSNGWFNVCSMMRTEPERVIYPRGYPYSKRWNDGQITKFKDRGRVVLNAGLWLGDPDVDAVTRLNEPVTTVELLTKRLMLAPGTYSPINTQNTAFHRDMLPCYYYVLTGGEFKDLGIDRYGDIWSGLFAKKVVDHMGDRVTFGLPLTDHRRNWHDLFKDLQQELRGMIFTESLVQYLDDITLSADSYAEAYVQLAEKLHDRVVWEDRIDEKLRNYFSRLLEAMRIWVDSCGAMLY
jgi:hypothetical protein